jgi:hypothetical protein
VASTVGHHDDPGRTMMWVAGAFAQHEKGRRDAELRSGRLHKRRETAKKVVASRTSSSG